MSRIFDSEQLADRADDLTTHNGIERVFVSLDDLSTPPAFAWLEIEFYNAVGLADIVSDIAAALKQPDDIFAISGGSRILGDAPPGRGPVRVTEVNAVSGANKLQIKVAPVGDYSSYKLKIIDSSYAIDPLFASVSFKFRPGCFNTNCAPLSAHKAAYDEPAINYLAKDFHSFKHMLISAMRDRVPGWEPTSEADLDQVIIDLIAADADELSDYQDRVMNEAYLGRARKRVTLARYARRMDYHIHQGNQASTWLALQVSSDFTLDKNLGAWTGRHWKDDGAVIFASQHDADNVQQCFSALNELKLYTWGNAVTALETGATEADVIAIGGSMTETQANNLRDILRREDIKYLLIEQKLNPDTATANGVDKSARQIVSLLTGDDAAVSVEDPVNGTWFVRVFWRASDRLSRRFCFVSQCAGLAANDEISKFHGNLIQVTQGRPHKTIFYPPGTPLGTDDASLFEKIAHRHFEQLSNRQLLRSNGVDEEEQLPVLLRIAERNLAYRDTRPGGEWRTRSSMKLEVAGFSNPWQEQADLIESLEDDTHYLVETDELGRSLVRFGNNINGRALPPDSNVTCCYQVGIGSEGNIGADALRGFDNSASAFPAIDKLWNPLDVDNGRSPELPEQIIRRVPQAYRARQLRAITLEDYVKRAEELAVVSHAHARYAWTGSWRTVRVSIDLKVGYSWQQEQQQIKSHLDAVRLIGEDLEVRESRFAALDILLVLCAHPDYWPQDLAFELAAEFSEGYNSHGEPGFFHPDLWTFGQSVHASQIIGRALSVVGVERVLLLSMRRWHSLNGPSTTAVTITPNELPTNEVDSIEVEPCEIIRVASDPNHLERGRMQFDIQGGRR
jgi:hypothetical protein